MRQPFNEFQTPYLVCSILNDKSECKRVGFFQRSHQFPNCGSPLERCRGWEKEPLLKSNLVRAARCRETAFGSEIVFPFASRKRDELFKMKIASSRKGESQVFALNQFHGMHTCTNEN